MIGKNRTAVMAIVSLGLALPGGASFAAEISTSDIVKKLAPKKPVTRSLTRSLKPAKSGMESSDKGFLRSLGNTRGIKFVVKKEAAAKVEPDYKEPTYKKEEIAKIGTIVKKYDLPKLDFQIEFEFGSSEVSGASILQVVELAKALQHPSLANTRVILGGHTDAKGSDGFNQILSQKRSDSVARLVAKIGGIGADRLVPIGFGEHKLKNEFDPNAAENRRVEVINISEY